MDNGTFIDREMSWLAFNYRVFQEVKDDTVPLYEKIKFMAIWSNNLDEFFRVRVATVRSLLSLKDKSKEKLLFDPRLQLRHILKTVVDQEREVGHVLRTQLMPELEKNGVFLITDKELSASQKRFLDNYYQDNILQHIQPFLLVRRKITPFLKNNRPYLAVRLMGKSNRNGKQQIPKRRQYKYALVEIPVNHFTRFVQLPSEEGKHYIIYLDDVIRYKLPTIFEAYDIMDCYSVKLTRDAELYIEDEFSGNLLTKILNSIKKRNTGVPARFLYDETMPKVFLNYLKESYYLKKDELIEGGKYHNFFDFFSFPNPIGKSLEYTPQKPLRHEGLDSYNNIFEAISDNEFALYFPYHTFDHVVEFLNAAAEDPDVVSIKMTQYRVAKNSKVIKAMIKAVENGKDVMVFVELKARFDEESNIQWAEEMKSAGVEIYYSFPGLKVHSKMAMVTRKEGDELKNYCFLGTGNFNEVTAKIYSDFGMFTARKNLTYEAERLFEILVGRDSKYNFKHLLVAKFNMRKAFTDLIDKEIELAKSGKEARIILKMNSIEERKMILKLYEASQAGVKIDLIIRGICCLIPGVKGMSENINIISIVDRYLEHSRIFIFNNGGKPKIFAGSADWMRRNLSRRIEVIFPVLDKKIKKEILDMINIQLEDNVKTRIIDRKLSNKYKNTHSEQKVRAQIDTYEYVKNLQ